MQGGILNGFRSLARSAAGKATADCKITATEAVELLLGQVILRRFDQKFYVFNGQVYQYLSEDGLNYLIHATLYAHIHQSGGPRLLNEVAKLLRSHPAIQTFATTDGPDRVYFLNGAFEVQQNYLRPVGATDFYTSYIPVSYPDDQDTTCPTFDCFLSTVSGGDWQIVQTIWEMMGYLIAGDTRGKCFFVLQGVGNSGKSVLTSLISNFFSPGAVAYEDTDQLRGRFDSDLLRGRKLNICGDLPGGRIHPRVVGLIKKLTGRDMVMGESKFKDAREMAPTCNLLFATNFSLQIVGEDDAFFDRMVTIPFRYAIPHEKQDKALLDKLLAERSAIAARALDAYVHGLRPRNFVFPLTGCGQCHEVYGGVSMADSLSGFLEQYCEFGDGFFAQTSVLQMAYLHYCEANGHPGIFDAVKFSRNLNQFCAGRIASKKRRVGGKPVNGYDGIRLREQFATTDGSQPSIS